MARTNASARVSGGSEEGGREEAGREEGGRTNGASGEEEMAGSGRVGERARERERREIITFFIMAESALSMVNT